MNIETITRNPSNNLPVRRGIVPIIVSLVLLWLLRDKIIHVDWTVMVQTALQFSLANWSVAALLTAVSFYAIAQYDRLVAIQMHLNIPRKTALAAGWRATAIGQVLGYGLVTGALTRWRALGRSTGTSLWDCSRLTAGVTTSFFLGWAAITSVAIVLTPGHAFQGWMQPCALLGLIGTLAILCSSAIPPRRLARHIPPPRFVLPVIGFTAVDTLAAASIIFIFLPEGYAPFLILYAAFLVALTAGMVSGLPGGLGAFEICLVSLLSPNDPAPLYAAILGFRMIYYAGPAILAGLSLIRPPATKPEAPNFGPVPTFATPFSQDAPPEADLVVQQMLGIRQDGQRSAVLWHRARNCDIVLGDPFGPSVDIETSTRLMGDASSAGRGLCFYKCSETIAKTLGRINLRIGSEAIVKTCSFSLNGSSKRQIRRKIRKAEKSGVVVAEGFEDYSTLEAIDRDWRAVNGSARGFSMGFLSRDLLSRQRVFVANHQGRAVGFVTFLIGNDRWTLDLIRMTEDCPQGSIHMAVCAAIETARSEEVSEVSLAAAPGYLHDGPATVPEKLLHAAYQRSSQLKGLAQFKASFAPEWQSRFIAASSLTTLCLATLDLWGLIHRPNKSNTEHMPETHDDYGFYEFDSPFRTCHARQRMTLKEAPHERDHSPGRQRTFPPSG